MEKMRKCEYCGKEFIAKNKLHKYCNVSCRDRNRSVVHYDYICSYCGKEYSVDTKHRGKSELHFCSKQCVDNYHKQHNELQSMHSSEYDLENFKLIKNNTIQYIQKKTN